MGAISCGSVPLDRVLHPLEAPMTAHSFDAFCRAQAKRIKISRYGKSAGWHFKDQNESPRRTRRVGHIERRGTDVGGGGLPFPQRHDDGT